jgi:hypothetical protein
MALHYLESLPRIDGWLHATTALAMMETLWLQERRGIDGDVAEIGVFRGKSLLALAAGARPSETIHAIDLFDTPVERTGPTDYDTTAYGQGNKEAFLANVREFFPGARIATLDCNSLDLRGHESEFGLQGLRLLSVDGGHTRSLTLNDLQIADACLGEAGICCLDDVFNVHWTGVASGLFAFLELRPDLVPVAMFPNKLFLCRPSWQPFYATAFRDLFGFALERERMELHDAEIDVFGDRWPAVSGTLRAVIARVAAHVADAKTAQTTNALDEANRLIAHLRSRNSKLKAKRTWGAMVRRAVRSFRQGN